VDGEKTKYSDSCGMSERAAAREIAQEKVQSGHITGVKKKGESEERIHLVNFYQSTLDFAGVIQSFYNKFIFSRR
jgi:hypothetical protein